MRNSSLGSSVVPRRRFARAAAFVVLGAFGALGPGSRATDAQDLNPSRVIRGVVQDSTTGQSLPSATIQVEGTFRGTVANADGRFELTVDTTTVVLVVRFIGYHSARVALMPGSPDQLLVRLSPSPVVLPEVVVSSEDPAVGIMRSVIREKQRRAPLLERYRAEAYTRLVIENDTGIVSMIESLTDVWWDHERGAREVVRSRRSTANMDLDEFLPAALLVQNLYADDIEVAGNRLVGVTHPKALDVYDFRLQGTRSLDGIAVFDISVQPKSRLASAFEGTVAVLDSAFALIDVDLSPAEAFLFPPPIRFFEVRYRQQFSEFAGDFWLPVDFRASYDLKVAFRALLDFPVFRIRQTSGLAGYVVGAELPDSLYAGDGYLAVDSVSVSRQGVLDRASVVIPLTARETDALVSIDSTMSIEEAFQPTGLLAGATRMSASNGEGRASIGSVDKPFSLRPGFLVNRVAGWQGELTAGVDLRGHVLLSGTAGYSGSARREILGAAVSARASRSMRAFAGWRSAIEPRARSFVHGSLLNSLRFLSGGADYFDYLDRIRTEVGVEFGGASERAVVAGLRIRQDSDSSIPAASPWTPLSKRDERANPAVVDGKTGSVVLSLSAGDPPLPFGIAGTNHVRLEMERARPGFLGGARDFTRWAARGQFRIPTFFRRRLLPNVLDVIVDGQWSSGAIPSQRFGIVDGNDTWATFGGLRTLGPMYYEGSSHLSVAWEHHFRTVPFERIGWRAPVRWGWGIIVHGAHATAHVSDSAVIAPGHHPRVPAGWHHEAGISLSGLFDIFRVDVTRRLDAPGWALTIGAARLF